MSNFLNIIYLITCDYCSTRFHNDSQHLIKYQKYSCVYYKFNCKI